MFASLIVELRLRHELLREELLRPVVVPASELDFRSLRFDDVLLERGLGAGKRRARGLKIGFGAPKHGLQLFLVELGEHVAGFHVAVGVDGQPLDDSVRSRLDFDLGGGLDLAGRHDGLHHRAGFSRDELARVDVGGRALDRETRDGGDEDHTERARDVKAFS
jgi:hypothetical protein